MSASTKLRWKRYLSELRFAHEELQFVKDISKEASREFQIHYEDFCVRNDIDLNNLNQEHSPQIQELYASKTRQDGDNNPQLDTHADGALVLHNGNPPEDIHSEMREEYPKQLGEYQMTQDELEIHETFNKLFRRIAMFLHPDKLPQHLDPSERKEKTKMFTDAKDALEKRKYFVLLDTAEKLRIAAPRNHKQQIRWMKKELKILNNVIYKEKKTYNYVFSECEEESDKDRVIKRFMKQVFGPQIFQQ